VRALIRASLAVFTALTLQACANISDSDMTPESAIAWNGASLHYREWGEAQDRDILLIHGAAANSADMEISLVPHLNEDYRVVAYDRPGLGRSEGRPDGAGTLAMQADAAAAVIRARGLERPVVVGHSFGGSVALRLALDHPDLIGGLVLISAPSHEWPGDGVSWYNYWSTAPVIGSIFNNIAVPLVAPGQLENATHGAFKPQSPPENYAERAETARLFEPASFRANADDIIGLKAEIIEQSEHYGRFDFPVAIFHGDADTTVWAEYHADRMAEQIDDSRLVILPGMGHMPHHFEQALIREHIDAVYADSRR